MGSILRKLYRFAFARRSFQRLNLLLLGCSLRGLGFLNHESDRVSGERAFLERHLADRPDAVVLDVGANVGNYAARILELCPSATVYAFEPHPKTFSALETRARSAGFHAVKAGVGAKPGRSLLFDYSSRDGSPHASVHRGVIEQIHHATAVEHPVDVISLDQFAGENGIARVDLLKVDTEGNELEVLKGFRDYLQGGKVSMIQFEFNEMNVFSRTYFRDFWELLPDYDFFRLLPDGMLRIDRYVPLLCEVFCYQNIVAIRRGGAGHAGAGSARRCNDRPSQAGRVHAEQDRQGTVRE